MPVFICFLRCKSSTSVYIWSALVRKSGIPSVELACKQLDSSRICSCTRSAIDIPSGTSFNSNSKYFIFPCNRNNWTCPTWRKTRDVMCAEFCGIICVWSLAGKDWKEEERRLGFSSLMDDQSKPASVHTCTPSLNYLLIVMRERWSVSPAKKYHTACEILRETSYLGLHLFTVCVLLQWFYKPPIPQPTHKKQKLWWFSSWSLLKRQPLNEEESVCGGRGGWGCVRACARAFSSRVSVKYAPP